MGTAEVFDEEEDGISELPGATTGALDVANLDADFVTEVPGTKVDVAMEILNTGPNVDASTVMVGSATDKDVTLYEPNAADTDEADELELAAVS